jgi:CelD/BcsL family acetyltransferase involved in cellulose biosynthesis
VSAQTEIGPETGPGSGTPAAGLAAAPGTGATGAWTVQTRRDEAAFATLEAEWDDLYRRSPGATPFQCWAWLESWWRWYGVAGRLRLVLVRRDGRLVAAAPLTLERRGPCRVLTPLGGTITDFTDVLVDGCLAEEAGRRLIQAVLALPGWDVLDLPEAPPGGVAEGLAGRWPGARWTLPASVCMELSAAPEEGLTDGLPARAARKLRAKIRRISASGIEHRRVPARDGSAAVAELLRLHREQWRGRGITPEHLRPRFAEHLARAVPAMMAAGHAVVTEYRIEDRLVLSDLAVVGHDQVGGYLCGVGPDARHGIDVSTLLVQRNAALAHELGRPTMSMLRGAEEYKLRWQPRPARNSRLLLARPGSVRARAYACRVRGRARAAAMARERMPWVLDARQRLRRAEARRVEARAEGGS